MVTRTGRFSGVLAATVLADAQLIDLPQQLLDAAAHLLALGMQHLQLFGKPGRLRPRLGDFLQGCVLFLPEPGYQLHGLLDAARALDQPLIEVHLSNPYRREPYRRRSYISEAATGVICGLGATGYLLAIDALAGLLKD